MSARVSLAILLATFVTHAAQAEEIVGPRAAGMGDANVGIPVGNDALFANPAGLALYPRYCMEFFWQRKTESDGNLFSASIVDSKSGAVAGGIAYTYDTEGPDGSIRHGRRLDIGPAYRLTGDAGLPFILAKGMTFGITGHNVVNPVEEANTAPRTLGAGASANLFGNLTLAVDWRQSFEREGMPWSWFFGAEYFAFGAFPLRAGYVIDQITDERRWTAGLGYIDQSFGIDLAYSRTVSDTGPEQYLELGVRLYL